MNSSFIANIAIIDFMVWNTCELDLKMTLFSSSHHNVTYWLYWPSLMNRPNEIKHHLFETAPFKFLSVKYDKRKLGFDNFNYFSSECLALCTFVLARNKIAKLNAPLWNRPQIMTSDWLDIFLATEKLHCEKPPWEFNFLWHMQFFRFHSSFIFRFSDAPYWLSRCKSLCKAWSFLLIKIYINRFRSK